jgi:hypothetical protein
MFMRVFGRAERDLESFDASLGVAFLYFFYYLIKIEQEKQILLLNFNFYNVSRSGVSNFL